MTPLLLELDTTHYYSCYYGMGCHAGSEKEGRQMATNFAETKAPTQNDITATSAVL